ncbi:nucleotidyl transferase AbiEii/AbiGii toxin family protein [candidate division WOR-3 bacterium]|nr:nucleotidyl transferase AbiEii/AbiGii toxin family protein [candidate division WOR-3 bacterium]
MLTFNSLIEQAKIREMPSTKIRGILREYLQILILKELYRIESGKELYFTGGTYLRLVHNIKRFSEDLDFNANKITAFKFEDLLKKLAIELKRSGIAIKVKFAHWNNMLVAKLIFPEIERVYNVVSEYTKKKGIIIKVETNKWKWRIKSETQVISGFGEFYPCICTDKGTLFADKVDALTKKHRGRHIYDIMFMLSNKFPIDQGRLKTLNIKEDPLKVILHSIKNFSKTELKKQAETLRPFLFDESEADLLADAHNIIPLLLEQYR